MQALEAFEGYEYAPVPVELLENTEAQAARLERLAAHTRGTLDRVEWIENNVPLWRPDVPYTSRNLWALANCSTQLHFKRYFTLDPPKTVLEGHRACCQHLRCPHCAIRREIKNVQKFEAKYQEIKKQRPGALLYYCVFTILNRPDLHGAYEHLQGCARLLINRRRDALKIINGKRRGDCALQSEFSKVVAGAYSIEIKRGTGSGDWHPHINFLLVTDGEILDKDQLTAEWERVTGDSFMLSCEPKKGDDIGAFIEIFKYAVKFSDMTPADNHHAATLLAKRRLLGSFGEFYGLKITEDPAKAPELDLTDLPYVDMFYSFNHNTGLYKLNSAKFHLENPLKEFPALKKIFK